MQYIRPFCVCFYRAVGRSENLGANCNGSDNSVLCSKGLCKSFLAALKVNPLVISSLYVDIFVLFGNDMIMNR